MNGLELPSQFLLIVLGAAIMLALLGLVVSAAMPASDRWSKRFFIAFFTVIVLYVGVCTVDTFIYSRPEMGAVMTVVYYFETLCSLLLLPMLTAYVLHCSGGDWRHSPVFRLQAALFVACFVLLNVTPFTTWFYYLTPEGYFRRGPLYPLFLLLPEAMQLLNIATVIRLRGRLPQPYLGSTEKRFFERKSSE